MFEVRPSVYRKNVQIAHIYGVRPSAPRYVMGMQDSERDAFRHLLLLCLPHHAEIDDRKTGEKLYPAEVLLDWKRKHEGENNAELNRIGPVDEDVFMEYVTEIFEPPLKRLESIAEQLERTGTLNASAAVELRRIVSALTENPVGLDARSVRILADAVDRLGGKSFSRAVTQFSDAATIMARATRRLPER
ncbi:hypothetical protein ACH495_02985 [Micromonospora sp. NPDC018662]|uniref:hypothetical protein n=1 Tax=Micromonospora sp. NPDC018662 TaxID=3364238 RepID=UPI0037A2CF08